MPDAESKFVDRMRRHVLKSIGKGTPDEGIPIDRLSFGIRSANGGLHYSLKRQPFRAFQRFGPDGVILFHEFAEKGPVSKYCVVLLRDYSTFEFVRRPEDKNVYELYSNSSLIGRIKITGARPTSIGGSWWQRFCALFTWITDWEIWSEDHLWGRVSIQSPKSSTKSAKVVECGALQLPLHLSLNAARKVPIEAMDFRRNSQLYGKDLVIPYGTPELDSVGVRLLFCTNIAFRVIFYSLDFAGG